VTRAVFLINTMGGGGAEKVVHHIAMELVRRGIDVFIIIIDHDNSVYLPVNGVNHIHLNSTKYVKSIFAKMLLFPLITYEVNFIINKLSPEYCCSLLTRSNFIHITTKLFGNKRRIIISERHMTFVAYNKGVKSFLNKMLINILYKYSDKIICISQAVADALENSGISKNKLAVVYNPLCIKNELIRVEKYAKFTIICVGRLIVSKDIKTIIEAFSLLSDKAEFQLTIVGVGPELHYLKELTKRLYLEDRVEFVGWIDDPVIIMSRCHVFVSASRNEGFGNVIIEAMYCGLPVISTNCPGGPKEILGNGKYGMTFDVGDKVELSRLIYKLYRFSKISDKYSYLSSLRSKQFNIKQQTDKYLKVIKCIN
jgi:glycosyltransferase involved in cell wall biosynthesis